MIKINLLPQRKAKRVAEPGQGQVLVGIGAIAAVAAVVFILVHRPMSSDASRLVAANEELEADTRAKQGRLKDFETLKKVVASSEARSASIDQLIKAKAVPAHMLHELGEILTLGRLPTMTKDMAERVGEGPKGDPNKRFQFDWDPKHVWITSFTETKGVFELKGGAQSDPDVTQLAKRMQASVYFADVNPQGGQRVDDTLSGVGYFDFTITGRVVY